MSGPAEAMIRRLFREELGPIREELAEIRDLLGDARPPIFARKPKLLTTEEAANWYEWVREHPDRVRATEAARTIRRQVQKSENPRRKTLEAAAPELGLSPSELDAVLSGDGEAS